MQENQQVVFLSDGSDSVRNLQAYLHPDSEHWLDWFHITMRITVLQQQVKTLKCEQPEVGEEVARELEIHRCASMSFLPLAPLMLTTLMPRCSTSSSPS